MRGPVHPMHRKAQNIQALGRAGVLLGCNGGAQRSLARALGKARG
jgi:hypothetical protein